MEKISMSRMAVPYKEKGICKEMIVQYLVDEGLIEDIRTITQKGEAAEIEYARGDGGAKWPVYGENIQKLVNDNIDTILTKYEAIKPQKQTKEKKKDTPTDGFKPLKGPTPFDEKLKYKYLGIDDDFVILDTETTGLDPDDEIVELSVVSSSGEELYHSYFYPSKEVTKGAMMVNHLSKRKLQGNPLFYTEWEKIKAAIGTKKIMGHNIEFDKRLIEQTLLSQNHIADEIEDLFKNMIDTRDIAIEWIDSKSYSLNKLTTLIGITREEQHNSTDDCIMTLEFVERLEDIIKIRSEYSFIKVSTT